MNEELKNTLETLIQSNTDSLHALETATNNVTDADCMMLLRRLAEERSIQITQLQELLAMEQEFPAAKGTLPGDARRVWIAVRGTISGQDELSVLPEVTNVEEQLRQEYETALPIAKNTAVSELIAAHTESVTAACNCLAELYELLQRQTADPAL